MDGTLVDTENLAASAIEQSLSKWNIPIDPLDAKFITGRTWQMAFDFLWNKYKFPVPRAEVENEMMSRYRGFIAQGMVPIEGAQDFVRACAKKMPIALVSGSSRIEIKHVLSSLKIEDCFQFYLGCEDYHESKPSPEGYLAAIERLQIKPSEAVVFEDSEAGIHSGVSAGCKVIAIKATRHYGSALKICHGSIENFKSLGPDDLGRILLDLNEDAL